jgi:hypothetical protein
MVTATRSTSRRVTAGRCGTIAAVVVEPVSGFEPLTVRLQGRFRLGGQLPLSCTRLAHCPFLDLALCSTVNADHIAENKPIHFEAVYSQVADCFVAEGQPHMRVRWFRSHKQVPLSDRVGRVLSSVAVGHPEGTRSALDRFRKTPIVSGGGLGSALLPKPRKCQDLSFSPDQAAARRCRPGARARWVFARLPARGGVTAGTRCGR